MLGKVLQNFQQVGIYNQFCKAGRGCRCPSSSTGDIKSYVTGWGKPCFNVSASFSTKAKVSQTSLHEKSDTELWENLAKARSNTSDGELVINNGSKVNNSLFYRDDSDFDEPIFIHPSRECGATGRLFSTRPKISRHKSLDHAISTYRVNICGRRTFSLNDPGITKLIHKQGFPEQSGGNLFLSRFYHVLYKDGINYSNTSLVSKRSLSTRSECNIVAKLSVKDKSNVEPPQDRKKGTVSPNELGDSSHEPQTSTRYYHAFHPKNAEDSSQAGPEEDKLRPEVGKRKLVGSGAPKGFPTSQSNDVLKPDRRSDSVYKIQLGAKSPSDLDARIAYSTSSDDADMLRRSDLDRKDPRAKLPDQCAPKRNMSSVETKASQKGDPPSSVKMELKGKKKAKAKPPPKKKGKKAPKKKKAKKKVCGSEQSSKISCLDICHTRTSCALKAKKRTKGKPQKCLGIGCRKGLGGLCYKLKNMFKKDRKCKLRKGKK